MLHNKRGPWVACRYAERGPVSAEKGFPQAVKFTNCSSNLFSRRLLKREKLYKLDKINFADVLREILGIFWVVTVLEKWFQI
jgi:hypothetical protein